MLSLIKNNRVLKIILLILGMNLLALLFVACESLTKKNVDADYPHEIKISILVENVSIGSAQEIIFQSIDGASVEKILGSIQFMDNSCDAEFKVEGDRAFITANKQGSATFFVSYKYSGYVPSSGKGSSGYNYVATAKTNVLSIVALPQIAISTVEELMALESDKSYYLTNDIDCSLIAFKPIDVFNGLLSGNGYTISNLTIDTTISSKIGLFRELNGTIENLSVSSIFIATESSVTECGTLAGINNGVIRGCTVSGGIQASKGSIVGGIAGISNGGIHNTNSSVNVVGDTFVGGIVGLMRNPSNHTSLVNYGRVIGNDYVGGILGSIYTNVESRLSGALNYGNVGGQSQVGGIGGQSANTTIEKSTNYGSISGRSYLGGISGSGDNYELCINEGDVVVSNFNSNSIGGSIRENYIGGISGSAKIVSESKNYGNISYVNLFAENSTNTVMYVGGIAGRLDGKSTNNYNYGSVKGKYYVGGIFGVYWADSLSVCVNEGRVEARYSYAGGIVAYAERAEISYCTNSGEIYGSSIGGIVSEGNSLIGCVNTGSIISSGTAGGIANNASSIQECENRGSITSTASAGGIANNASSIQECENRGSITSTASAGGIAANADSIVESKNIGDVSGKDFVGGIAANCMLIYGCENYGSVVGFIATGGISGSAQEVDHSTNYGLVSGSKSVGGIAGTISATYSTVNNNNVNYGNVLGIESVGGIFGLVDGGDYVLNSNLGDVEATGIYVGGCFGQVVAVRTILQCINRGRVTGQDYVGGIVGARISTISESAITQCANYGTIIAPSGAKKSEMYGSAY